MNSPLEHPDLEALIIGVAEGDAEMIAHSRACEACAAVLELDRQLEKDLFRIQDPLPPPNFTQAVMAKVANAPAPVSSEVKAGLGVIGLSIALFVGFLVAGGHTPADLGSALARVVVELRTFAIAISAGMEAIWGTAFIPAIALALALLFTSYFGIRRLAGATQSA